MKRRRLVRIGWGIAAILLALVVLQLFVVDVYRVDSGSMEPTLHGPGPAQRGESVLVLYRRAPKLERFDLAVILRDGESEPLVKRVAGLPGESILISGGDLFVDGKRLPPDARRAPLVTLFDERQTPLKEALPALAELARREGDAWIVEPDERGAARADLALRATDGYRDARGVFVDGPQVVNDLAWRFDVRLERVGSRLCAWLTEEGDRFAADVERTSDSRVRLKLLRELGGAPAVESASAELELEPRAWTTLFLANVDNILIAELGGTAVSHVYDTNTPLAGARDPRLQHRVPRAGLEFSGGPVGLRALEVLRDLYYTHRDTIGVDAPLQLGPGELFVLGDHSSESRDSRSWGPVELGDVIARPAAVVWPLAGLRRLPAPRSLFQ